MKCLIIALIALNLIGCYQIGCRTGGGSNENLSNYTISYYQKTWQEHRGGRLYSVRYRRTCFCPLNEYDSVRVTTDATNEIVSVETLDIDGAVLHMITDPVELSKYENIESMFVLLNSFINSDQKVTADFSETGAPKQISVSDPPGIADGAFSIEVIEVIMSHLD